MAVSFSRSMRSLEQDNYRFSLIGLIVAVLLLSAWSAWFFLADIALYETSETFEVQRDGSLAVKFSPQALGRIRPGQTVVLYLNGAGEHGISSLPGLVMDVPSSFRPGDGSVEVYVFSPESLGEGVAGQVQVEVDHVSPAQLLMHSTEQLAQNTDTAISVR
jgi:hypothetical protein